ncbi:hypothetical protein Y032_0329g2652 [Ancylostoma ceylanicum]|nr:hypothetical protein Y032_0329g2652 [Ancylostoma ceylanicum]
MEKLVRARKLLDSHLTILAAPSRSERYDLASDTDETSMVFITPVDIPSLIKDFQKIVVELNESDVINLSLSHAHRVADLIQRRSGDAPLRHIPGQDFETEHKESRIKQLRDLDSENRQLRQLYEDSQWTLHLVMEAHRRELDNHFCQDSVASASSSETRNDAELDSTRKQFHQNAAIMARGVNEVFQHEQRMKEAFAKRMEELEMENEVLRCVLESQPGVDADTILQRLEQRMATSIGSPGDVSMNCSGEYDCRENLDEEATPVKKQSTGQKKLDVT